MSVGQATSQPDVLGVAAGIIHLIDLGVAAGIIHLSALGTLQVKRVLSGGEAIRISEPQDLNRGRNDGLVHAIADLSKTSFYHRPVHFRVRGVFVDRDLRDTVSGKHTLERAHQATAGVLYGVSRRVPCAPEGTRS